MTATLNASLLSSSRVGADLGRMLDVESDVVMMTVMMVVKKMLSLGRPTFKKY